ncbi:phosphohydrolase [Chimaeribacter arupi]|uniref:phosphohydrolase n=1 Tax=Chimaeribacter arupi TaxID=2060066 RepID=UPI000C7D4C30|nr:phosphohydrolase [Chimaeribacter arupi]PLR46022.1 phosphohydrolase [Chimaeribacter arupi]
MVISEWEIRFQNYMASRPEADKAHDINHLHRVWQNAQLLMQGLEANRLVVLAACYFHDFVNLPKNHPQRHLASTMAAQETLSLLQNDFPDFPPELYDAVAHAVRTHSFSANIPPQTLEAKIVQDADRLDTLGAIGLARVFYVSGALGRDLVDPDDPLAERRELDDRRFTLDHFQQKLLRLPATMQTQAGRVIAEKRTRFLQGYMETLCAELRGAA